MRRVTAGRALLFISIVGFATGIGLSQYRMLDSVGTAFASVLISYTMFAWFCDDSWSRSYRRSAILNTAFVSLTVIALPYYLIRSRGIKKGIIATAGAAAIFVSYPVSVVLGTLVVRHI